MGKHLVLVNAFGYAFSVGINGLDSMKNLSRKMRAGDLALGLDSINLHSQKITSDLRGRVHLLVV